MFPMLMVPAAACRHMFLMAVAVCVVGTVNGCAASDPDAEMPATMVEAAMLQSRREEVRSRLLNRDAGLEVRRWVCRDEQERIIEAVAEYGEGSLVDEATRRRLQANGFRLVRVPMDRLEAFEASLGGLTADIEGWYGQVFDWQELHRIAAGVDRRAVVYDGRAQRVDEGEFRLVLRTWIMRTEDGPRVHVRIVPTYRVTPTVSYQRLLGERRDEGTPLVSAVMDLMLEPGYAGVLISETPGEAWPNWSSDAELETARRGAAAAGPGPGPAIDPPATIGEMMLSSRAGLPSRGLIVLIPRIPESMRLPADEGTEAGRVVEESAR